MPPTELSWYSKVAKKMVREGKNFILCLDELMIDGIRPVEAKLIQEGEVFQQILRNERFRYATEIASNPQLSKNVAVGMMMQAVERLMGEGEWDKALEGLQKLAKLAGWQGADSQVTVFADLKGKEIEELRKSIGQRGGKDSFKSAN